jgi:hypothetical protein
MARTSPVLYHSCIFFAGVSIDMINSTRYFQDSPEIISHKVEAIRQINLELSADELSDAIILAILSMITEPTETELERQERIELDAACPFKPPPMPIQWRQNWDRLVLEDVHYEGVYKIVNLKGGMHKIKSPCVSKSLSQ